MEKPNTNIVVESNEQTNENVASLELEIRRSRKIRSGVKAGTSRTMGNVPVTER